VLLNFHLILFGFCISALASQQDKELDVALCSLKRSQANTEIAELSKECQKMETELRNFLRKNAQNEINLAELQDSANQQLYFVL
jgi:flagellar motility protein MotE (MotC chaperone)